MQNGRTVHIVNDDATARRSLVDVLGEAGFGATTYDSADALLAVAPELFGGCALVQVRMPAMDGFAIQSQLHDMKIHLPVVIIAAQGDVATAVRAMKAGAVDVVETPYSHEALVSTIETAFERNGQLQRQREAEEAATLIARLSPREHEVLQALTAGRSNKAIAFDLGLSVRTVEVHRARMMERLGVKRLAEAVRLAVLSKFA